MSSNTTTATFADDTAILAVHKDPIIASQHLQDHMILFENWLKMWIIKANETKSTQSTFTLRKQSCPPVNLNDHPSPQSETVKYLGMLLDRRRTWKPHIWNKRSPTTEQQIQKNVLVPWS